MKERIKELGLEVKSGKITWQIAANTINEEYSENLSAEAVRKRYSGLKENNPIHAEVIKNQFIARGDGSEQDTIEITTSLKNKSVEDKIKILGYDPDIMELVFYQEGKEEKKTEDGIITKLKASFKVKPKIKEVSPEDFIKIFEKKYTQVKPLKLEPQIKNVLRDNNKLIEAPGMEMHIGKSAIEGNNEEEKINKIIQGIINKQAIEQAGTLLVYIGNDLFNSEMNQMTTKGTPQFNTMDYEEMFDKATEMYIKFFLTLREYFNKIEVKYVPGNHEERISFVFYRLLGQAFKKDNIIKIDPNVRSTQVYEFGKCAIFTDHGDFTNGKKTEEFLKSLVNEFPEVIGRTIHREAHLGHLHIEFARYDTLGITLRRVTSPSGTDKWHLKNRYLSNPKYQLFTWHKYEGLKNIEYITFESSKVKKK